MNLRFVPGYYEWTLYNGDEDIYTWEDFLEDLPEEVTEEAACDTADLLMYVLRNDFEEKGKKIDESFFVAATEVIANEIYRRYAA